MQKAAARKNGYRSNSKNKSRSGSLQKAEGMGSQAAAATSSCISSLSWVAPNSPQLSFKPSILNVRTNTTCIPSFKAAKNDEFRFLRVKTRATVDEKDEVAPTPLLVQEVDQPNREIEESVKVLKEAAKTRKVAAQEVLSALSVIEKAKIDPSGFLETLGRSESPGRIWMLIFAAEKKLKSGRYFPLTAVQRFDAAAKRIENGIYLGPIGCLSFEGRFSWKNRILAFIFECVRIKIGSLKPLEIGLGQNQDREPSNVNKDPFFVWFYIDEEIAVARGRSGGTAFWCQCHDVPTHYFP